MQNDKASCGGRFVALSSNGMNIKSSSDLEVGSLLRLEIGDDLMMTEVCHCEPDEGEYSAGLSILAWLEKAELKRLLRETMGPEAVTTPIW